MSCKDHFEHTWKKGDHFPLLKCKKCGQVGRIVILWLNHILIKVLSVKYSDTKKGLHPGLIIKCLDLDMNVLDVSKICMQKKMDGINLIERY